MTAAEHELLSGNSTESYEARKFADNNFAFGAESPLNETSLNMVWGTGHRYLSDRYGALVDVYPSTKSVSPLPPLKPLLPVHFAACVCTYWCVYYLVN